MIESIKHDMKEAFAAAVLSQRMVLALAAIMILAAAFLYWRGWEAWRWGVGISASMIIMHMLAPGTVTNLYRLWMAFAALLGWFMTRGLLLVAYVLLIVPIGVLLKIGGKDLLDVGVVSRRASYWSRHEPARNREQYTKQF